MQQCQNLKDIMKNNILISSAGRRVELLNYFKTELKAFKKPSKILATDLNPILSSACHAADNSFQICHSQEEGFIEQLLNICLENEVRLVIPTIDNELLTLSRSRERFREYGIDIVVSDYKFIEECRDKRKTRNIFNKLDIIYPEIFDKNNLIFPSFCKPYDGSSSIGSKVIETKNDLTLDVLDNPKNIFMEYIPSNYVEYTVDSYFTFDGQLISFVPRERIEVRSGEVSKGVTRRNFLYDFLLEKIKVLPGARGCITFQFFVDVHNKEIKGLEINPRFGGGYPLSYSAGSNFPKYIIDEYLHGKNLEFFDKWDNNLLMLRYDKHLLVSDYDK